MKKETDNISFGRYLQTIRLQQGIRLEDISAETKIGPELLQYIEKEDHNRLPAEVFVKGFLRSYASSVNADGDEAVRRYLQSKKVFNKTTRIESDLINLDTTFRSYLMLFFGLFVLLVILSVWGLTGSAGRKNEQQPMKKRPTTDRVAKNKPIRPVETVQNVDDKKKSPQGEDQRLWLKIEAVEKTWMKIITDNQEPREYSLKEKDRLLLKADEGYRLLIGNAAGVRILLNEKPVDIEGKRGQVVMIQLP